MCGPATTGNATILPSHYPELWAVLPSIMNLEQPFLARRVFRNSDAGVSKAAAPLARAFLGLLR